MLVVFMAIITICLGVFCYVQKLWIKSVENKLTYSYQLIGNRDFSQASAELAFVSIFPSNKKNQQNIYEQKAIIAAHNGDVDLAVEYFDKTKVISRIGKYYFGLVNEIKEFKGWETNKNIIFSMIKGQGSEDILAVIAEYQNLNAYQSKSVYRELLLAQILFEMGELKMAKYTLSQSIKKDPEYRDAYVLMLSVKKSLGEDAEEIKYKIRELDPNYF